MKLRGILLSLSVALCLAACGASAHKKAETKPEECGELGKPDPKHPLSMPYGNPWCEGEVKP
jgi:hypothetical protein